MVGVAAEQLCAVRASTEALHHATIDLSISAAGIPGMLVALAATGALRGLQDTRTPLVAAVAGFGANLALNLWFVLGLGWGIAGSARGTVIAQTCMAVGLVAVLARGALRERRASPRPDESRGKHGRRP